MAEEYIRGGKTAGTGKGGSVKNKKRTPAHRGAQDASSPVRQIKIGDGSLEDLFGFILGDNKKNIFIDVPEKRGKPITKTSEKNKVRIDALNAMRNLSNKVSVMGGERAKDIMSGFQGNEAQTYSNMVGQNPNLNELARAKAEAMPAVNQMATEEEEEMVAKPPIVESPANMIQNRGDMIQNRGGSPFETGPTPDVASGPPQQDVQGRLGGAGPMQTGPFNLARNMNPQAAEDYTNRQNAERVARVEEIKQRLGISDVGASAVNQTANNPINRQETPVSRFMNQEIRATPPEPRDDIFMTPPGAMAYGGKVQNKKKEKKKAKKTYGKSYNY